MPDGDELITVDRETLDRSATVLRQTADGLAAVSTSIANAPIGATAFGAMNSWMIAPIVSLASASAEHLRISGSVVDALATATDDAANDFETTEDEVIAWVAQLDANLDAATSPPAPPAAEAPTTPLPQPSPSPGPAPTPPPEDPTP